MDKKEMLILISFLKNGFSSRKIDELLGHDSKKTRGWESWNVLKQYHLKKEDKGRLFIYNKKECRNIISELNTLQLNELLKKYSPSIVEKYQDTKILAKNENILYQTMSGETRNIIKYLFNSLKKSMNSCQFEGCNNKNLETAHMYKERPEIFKEVAKKLRKINGDYFEYEIKEIMQSYLEEHNRKQSVCFLCKQHHVEFDNLARNGTISAFNKFKNKINLD